LDFFSLIVPCGLTNKPVTSMERELQKRLTLAEVATAVSRNFGWVFHSQMLWLESLDDLLAQATVVPKPEPAESPANQDTPARVPKELRNLHGDSEELA
jgi:lipoyl(octanoyl) transferase